VAVIFLWLPARAFPQEDGITPRPPDSLTANQSAILPFIVIANYRDIQSVQGFFRTDTTIAYTGRDMVQDTSGVYWLYLRPEELTGDTLYYFAMAQLSDHGLLAYPEDDPAKQPAKIPLTHPAADSISSGK